MIGDGEEADCLAGFGYSKGNVSGTIWGGISMGGICGEVYEGGYVDDWNGGGCHGCDD